MPLFLQRVGNPPFHAYATPHWHATLNPHDVYWTDRYKLFDAPPNIRYATHMALIGRELLDFHIEESTGGWDYSQLSCISIATSRSDAVALRAAHSGAVEAAYFMSVWEYHVVLSAWKGPARSLDKTSRHAAPGFEYTPCTSSGVGYEDARRQWHWYRSTYHA